MKKYVAEFIGTYALVFFGTGAVVINEVSGGMLGHLGIAFAFGFIVIAMIYAIGDVSGAHINPAVTLAFAVAKKFPAKAILPYLVAQFVGAVLASGSLKLLFPDATTMGETLPAGTDLQSFILEVILTFFLMFIILQVATGTKETGIMAGLAIGFTVLLEALVAGPICGASMNPARSFAPALLQLNLEQLWIYLIAPPIGSIAAVVAWTFLQTKD